MRHFDDSSGYADKLSTWAIADRLAWPALFCAAEIWAVIVVLTEIRVRGVQAAALAFVLASVVLVVWSEIYGMCGTLRRPSSRSAGDKAGGMSTGLV